MNTFQETLNLIDKIILEYSLDKNDKKITFSDLSEKEQEFFQTLIDSGLITKEYFPMSEKNYKAWKAMKKYGII